MALPTLTPLTNTNRSILPSTGTISYVNDGVAIGVYSDPTSPLYSVAFLSGAVDQVKYTYRKLGGDVLDIELTPANVYANYEEAVLEYSYLINIHQSKNIIFDVLGNTTGTFDHDGTLLSGSLSSSLGTTHVSLKYPKLSFDYAQRAGDWFSSEAGFGGTTPIYSASINITASVQDYDLQSAVEALSLTSSYEFYNQVGNNRIDILRVFYKTPNAMWRFYGYYGGLNVVGNLSSYGQYADDSTFELVPVWQNKLQGIAYETAIFTRNSHFSYEIKNNKLRLFPAPVAGMMPEKIWFDFKVSNNDSWEENIGEDSGINGINNMNTIPFANIPYQNINSIGKQWIRRFALALSKETLGQIRGKINPIPIPNGEQTLNADALLSQAKDEQQMLREELKTVLDEMVYSKLAAERAELTENIQSIEAKIPTFIYVG